MTIRRLAIALGVLCLLDVPARAQSSATDAPTSVSLQSATIDERGTVLLLRFDRPINHRTSWLSLVRDGQVVATVHFRLEAAPNVLFARIQTPAPGSYVLRWLVCPAGGNEGYQGELPFTVGQVAGPANPML